MIDQGQRQPFSREDRDELASIAGAAQRRNRPTHLVAAAGVLLVGALALAGSALLSRQSAQRALERSTAENVRAKALMAEIQRIRDLRDGQRQTTGANDPYPNFGSQMGNLATQAGLTVGIPSEVSRASGPLIRREYTYALPSTDNLGNVMAWVQRASAEIPGTHVISLAVTPTQAARTWTVNIKFARLERAPARTGTTP